jgi:hypothetical protein
MYNKYSRLTEIHRQQVPRVELLCGRAGDDGNVMATQLVRPALRILLGRATCMAASCCTCMTWGIIPPCASMVVLALCVRAHVLAGAGLLVRGGDLSCEAEICRARQRLVVEAETSRARWRLVVGIPLAGNWSEMQPTDRRPDVLPVWVLTRVFSPHCPESLP